MYERTSSLYKPGISPLYLFLLHVTQVLHDLPALDQHESLKDKPSLPANCNPVCPDKPCLLWFKIKPHPPIHIPRSAGPPKTCLLPIIPLIPKTRANNFWQPPAARFCSLDFPGKLCFLLWFFVKHNLILSFIF